MQEIFQCLPINKRSIIQQVHNDLKDRRLFYIGFSFAKGYLSSDHGVFEVIFLTVTVAFLAFKCSFDRE